MDTIVREVHIADLPVIIAKLEKLNRRAMKIGQRVNYTANGQVTRVHEWKGEDENDIRVIRFTEVEIEPTIIGLAGWEFVATLSYVVLDSGREVIISAVPGQQIPVEFRSSTPDRCDHCQRNQYRIETFVVRNAASGEYRQVGRQCLAVFLGQDPSQVVAMTRILSVMDEEDFWGGSGGSGERGYAQVTYLAAVHQEIRLNGWVSRAKARELFIESTASAAIEAIDPPKGKEARYPEPVDIEAATQALVWHTENWADLPEQNDYQHNLNVAIRMGPVVAKTAGLVASLIPVWQREVQKARETVIRAARPVSQHAGIVGKRSDFDVMVVGERWIEGQFGTTCLVTMVDEAGSILKWFASNPPDALLKATDRFVRISGTVRDHGDWRGEKQTNLTRCVLWTDEAVVKADAKVAKADAKAAR